MNELPVAATWNVQQANELYGVDRWSNDLFSIRSDGDLSVHLTKEGQTVKASIPDIVSGIRERGLETPLLLRFHDLLTERISKLNEAFHDAIEESNYRGHYRGVYPIKVNQQQQVIEGITQFGEKYHFGLEAGSKPELLAALAYMHDPEAYIICNGYKDQEFIDLALQSLQMGLQIVLVVEMPSELDLILERSAALGIEPIVGIRAKLSTSNNSHWSSSGGENSVFGLTTSQIINAVETLREHGKLGALQLLHYHQGSQVPDIRAIREAAAEATRIYTELEQLGAAMGLLDIGGGLGINYDGSSSSGHNSRNYGTREYAADIVDVVKTVCDESGTQHPTIISESGRAVAAYYSVLIFNILDVNSPSSDVVSHKLPEDPHPYLVKLSEVEDSLNAENLQECYNDANYFRNEIFSLFRHGNVSLHERAYCSSLFVRIITQIMEMAGDLDQLPEELGLITPFIDVYYGNFSLFQSLPDSWAINQFFPVMPIHRLDEEPTTKAIIADITCDCDGRIDNFIINGEHQKHIRLHELKSNEDYLIGVFLVGAYQETLGDLHNLLGDTNVVSVGLKDGKVHYLSELAGDTVSDVLSYVEYDPKSLVERFRSLAERSVVDGKITPSQRRQFMNAYCESIGGYTYFESPNH
ncbi:MAG: biosynthetic arginine decarboxylase [Verrucomicrobiaceae bacterium]|jgi:arginine decarboxylase|nr:biosynthetic arginine decarboxylase [Verrucomicrobiaceae bacterium]